MSYAKCGVRLLGRRERLLHSKVKLELSALEPSSPASCKLARLGKFNQAKQLAVKRSCFLLAPFGHGKLNVVQAQNSHCAKRLA